MGLKVGSQALVVWFTVYTVAWIKISIKNKKKFMNIFSHTFNCEYSNKMQLEEGFLLHLPNEL